MDTTIAKAWGEMVTNRPVTSRELLPLVNQVLDELSEVAALADGPRRQSEHDKPFKLEYGFSIAEVRQDQVGEMGTRVSAIIERPRGDSIIIGLQAGGFEQKLGVTMPGIEGFTYWTPEDGPQKQWALRNLRQRLAECISPA